MNQIQPRGSAARRGLATAGALLAAVSSIVALGALSSPTSAAVESTDIVKTVTYNGKTLTLRMSPVTVRSSSYRVDVQQADGSLKAYAAAPSKAYIGSVDGDSSAVAEGIINSDGDFVGQVVFDRGGTIYVKNGAVTGNRSLTQPADFKWPSAGNSSLNATTRPGQAGDSSYLWDIGYDLDNGYFNAAPISGSVAKAVDQIDLNIVSQLGAYATNIKVRPMVGRVLVRASAAVDPYVGKTQGQRLGVVSSEWKTYGYPGMDSAMILTDRDAGSGVAYLGTAGSPGYGNSGGTGNTSIVVQRHEFGHNWNALDNHTNGPEGGTINSGNGYDRWDGTEVRSMLDFRNSRLDKFTDLGAFPVALPPYASLDLVDRQMATVTVKVNPIVNDHDVNGGALTLQSVSATSKLGGTLTAVGNTVTYTPPAVTSSQTVDWAQYVVKDPSGKTATGVMLFRVDPYVAPAPSSSWVRHDPAAASGYQMTNQQSGLVAAIPAGSTGRQAVVQRAGLDARTVWTFKTSGKGLQIANKATGLCVGTEMGQTASGTRAIHNTCNGRPDQQWKIVDHPRGDRALINVSSGKCLSVKDGSLNSGVELVQMPCSMSADQIWKVDFLPTSSWPAYTPPTTGTFELVNAGTGLHAGTAPGASWSAPFVQRAAGKETAFTFLANADGTYRVRQSSSGLCFNDEAAQHDRVVIWNCNEATEGAKVRFLEHPAGGMVMVGVLAKECIGIKGDSKAVDANLEFDSCTSKETQRWSVVPTA
ncbi:MULTISPECIES: RICIN domain-containing protein [unclassified Nocardioides]|uniref:RICIN domain-containing protein n=1 Tax=unclassified Nocardioides TaxID=2615069 RepID=UPI0006FEF579|nr:MULTISPECIES: RICIN domain-containing protein [unclassified Nocardioides]KRA37690.1 hypothetical protein ASD81_03040 [Nocardioides sp. Root614]KRA91650.1 hypothetical protein ASD84_03305 [Nocardioides sp. Root682]